MIVGDAPLADPETLVLMRFGRTPSRSSSPAQGAVTLRLDRGVLRWFRANGRGYQTRINAVLRSYYLHEGGNADRSGHSKAPRKTQSAAKQ
jgi:uncharacterized protein (DUF4415 family)